MYIYTTKQIKNWDTYTIQKEGIASVDLMERAAQAVVHELTQSQYGNKPFFIFCGNAGNGGDGLAIARLLFHQQKDVRIFILSSEKYSDDCKINLQRLADLHVPVKKIKDSKDFPAIATNTIIIDALLGSGLNRPISGLTALLIQHINQHKGSIIAIDIPSGLFADKSSLGNTIVKANTTLSFHIPKLAFLAAENAPYVGIWKLLDIGLHAGYTYTVQSIYEWIEMHMVQSLVRPKEKFAHKYQFGHALLCAGSPGMYGAGIMCAKGCLKSGVGLVSILAEEKHFAIYQMALPEAMCIINWEDENIYFKKNAIGIGPGWPDTETYASITKKILTQKKLPVVVDASALNVLATIHIQPGTIITPHTGEFDNCFGKSINDFSRIERAIQKAKELGIYIILKGAYTAIATPEGKVYFNSTGNPGMAKGGSGDILTGIITGLLSQGYQPLHACILGVYLHGLAGDIAAEMHTQFGMTATHIIEHMEDAWKIIFNK